MVPVRSANIGLPVMGRQVSTFAAYENWLEGWRFRPAFTMQLEEYTDPLLPPSAQPASRSHSYAWHIEPESTRLWIAFYYRADEPVSGGAVNIRARLRSPIGGAVIDEGCNWDLTNGDIIHKPDQGGPVDVRNGWGELSHTGFRDDPAIDPTAPSARPRWLELSGVIASGEVELLLTAEHINLYTVSVWEIYRATL